MKFDIDIDKKRHILKAVTWRIIASSLTFLLIWIATGEIIIGASVGIVDMLIKMVAYYYHERLWFKYINFGIKHKRKEK